MALQNIIDKILSESSSEADSILAEARAAAKEIETQGREKAEAEKENRIRRAEEEMRDDRLRRLALAKLESRKRKLAARRELINEVFVKVGEELKSLEGEKLKKLITGILEDFAPGSRCEIICNEKDEDKFSFVLSSVWGAAFTKHCEIKGVKEDLGGGFILRTEKVEYDCTFKRLVGEKKEALEAEVVSVLFSDDSDKS